MSEIEPALKAFGTATAVVAAITAVAALLKILTLFLQGLQQAQTGSVPIEILTAIIFVAVFASLPWWAPIDA